MGRCDSSLSVTSSAIPASVDQRNRRPRATLYITLIAAVAALGGLLFGFDTGVIAGAMLFIVPEFHLGPTQQGLVVSAVTFGALFGALAGGSTSDRLGRRRTNIAAGTSFVVGSILSAIAPNVYALVASRVIIGLAIGMTSVAAPMYIAELSPPGSRGRLVSLFQLAITVGILISYVVDRGLAPQHAWRLMLGLAFIPGALLVLGMFAMPESPRWLLKSGADKAARDALALVRLPDQIEEEVREIREDLVHNRPAAWSELFMPGLRPAVLVGVGLAVFQQVTGINTIIYYAPQIFQRAGLDNATTALAATVGIGTINVLSTLIAMWLVDRIGRKPLLLAGLAGMIASLVVVGASQRFGSAIGINPDSLAPLTVGFIGLYIVCFAFSLGPVVWLMISEIFPNQARARGAAISTAANWMANFLVSLSFPILQATMGPSLWFLYAAMGVAAFVFIVGFVPETRGKSLEDISRQWRPALAVQR
ncbi:MAG TPA: sugar porter family MFS transporter [Candidatus Binatus sp.]|nr:sugar porter family MFS transporter [Candidatus Binatus sp.]